MGDWGQEGLTLRRAPTQRMPKLLKKIADDISNVRMVSQAIT